MESQPSPTQTSSLPSREAGLSAQSQRRRRRRPAFSCHECRRRKIKCNQNNPCAHCVRSKTQCTYKNNGTYQGESVTGSTQLSRQQRETRSQRHDTPDISHPATSNLGNTVSEESNSRPVPGSGSQGDIGESISASPEANTAPSPSHKLPEDSRKWQAIFEKSRDWGKSRWTGAANEFAPLMACYSAILSKKSHDYPQKDPETPQLISQAGEALKNCKATARGIKLGRPSRGSQIPEIGVLPVSREIADTMATLYLNSFESAFRILHIPTFWSEYRKSWDESGNLNDSITYHERLKIHLVVGIGSSLYDHGDRAAALQNIDMVQRSVYAAQAWLSGPLEKDRLDFSGLQIFCLTIIARQIFSIGDDLTWISVGSLVHSAMQIGLHRDPKNLPATLPTLQAEVRRRLWYTILELVAQSSLDARMPPRISWDDFDTEIPSNVNDDDLSNVETGIQRSPRSRFTDTSTQLILIDSLQKRLHIVQLLNGIHSKISFDQALSFGSEIMGSLQTCSKLRDHLASTPFHRNLLDFLARRFIIPLHFPFSNQAQRYPIFHYSLQISLDSALAMISPEPDDAFSRLIEIGGGLFREIIRSTISALCIGLLRHVGDQQANATLHRTPQYRQSLKQAVKDLIALSQKRIELGETNVKGHMFLCMILAQVEAMEVNKPIDLWIARAARDSLEMCNDILRMREGRNFTQPFEDVELGMTELENTGFGLSGDGLDLEFDEDFFLSDIIF